MDIEPFDISKTKTLVLDMPRLGFSGEILYKGEAIGMLTVTNKFKSIKITIEVDEA